MRLPLKGIYEALLKRVEELRLAYERGRRGQVIDDETWRTLIWPTAFPSVVLDDAGRVDLRENTYDHALREAVTIRDRHGGALWVEVWPYRTADLEVGWVSVCVQGLALVADLLGDGLEEIVSVGLRYHRVTDTREGPARQRYGHKPFDLNTYETVGLDYLAEHTHPKCPQPGEAMWMLAVVAQAMLNFPPAARVRGLAKLAERGEVPSDGWGARYRSDLLAELPGALREMIENDNKSNHRWVRSAATPTPTPTRMFGPDGYDIWPDSPHGDAILAWRSAPVGMTPESLRDEWRTLVREYAKGSDFLVEPVLPSQQLVDLARAARNDPTIGRGLGEVLDQVASWLLVRLVSGGGLGRFAVDPLTASETRNLLLSLLRRHVRGAPLTEADLTGRSRAYGDYVSQYFSFVAALANMPDDTEMQAILRKWAPGSRKPIDRLLQRARGVKRQAGRGDNDVRVDARVTTSAGDQEGWGTAPVPEASNTVTPEEIVAQSEMGALIRSLVERLPPTSRSMAERFLSGDDAAEPPHELVAELSAIARAGGLDR